MTTPAPAAPVKGTLSGAVYVAIATLAVILVLGLVYLSGDSGREGALTWLTSVFVLAVGGISGVGVLQNKALNKQQLTTAAQVDQVQLQTNGSLDRRIEAAITRALAAVRAEESSTVKAGAVAATAKVAAARSRVAPKSKAKA